MQQAFRFYDIDPEQLSFDFPLLEDKRCYPSMNSTFGIDSNLCITNTALSSHLIIVDSSGVENTRVDDAGIHIRVTKKSWLKTKIANYLGINYL
jgi:hypothetical protein